MGDERGDVDAAAVVWLAGRRGPVEGPVTVAPATHHVPRPHGAAPAAADRDLDPGAVRRVGVPRRDELGEPETGTYPRRRPVGEAIATRWPVAPGIGVDRKSTR